MALQAPPRAAQQTRHVRIDAAKLREERQFNGLNRRQLGDDVGVTGGYIGQLESGRRATVSPALYVRLCVRLGLDRTELAAQNSTDGSEQFGTVEAQRPGVRAPRDAP